MQLLTEDETVSVIQRRRWPALLIDLPEKDERCRGRRGLALCLVFSVIEIYENVGEKTAIM